MPPLKNKIVVITGASSGIGAATARAFGRAGAKVVLAARRQDRLEALAQELLSQGVETLVAPTDITRLADIQRLVQLTLARFGRIDILFNNAGFGRLRWLDQLAPVEDIEAQFAVNVLGVVQTTRQVLPIMQTQRSGHILNMASVAGLVAAPQYTIYAATKFAVRGFTEALRREAAPWGIRVSLINPGPVGTEFGQHTGRPTSRLTRSPQWLEISAETVAQVVVDLARRPRAVVTLPWPCQLAAWLNAHFPALVDWITIRFSPRPERQATRSK